MRVARGDGVEPRCAPLAHTADAAPWTPLQETRIQLIKQSLILVSSPAEAVGGAVLRQGGAAASPPATCSFHLKLTPGSNRRTRSPIKQIEDALKSVLLWPTFEGGVE